MVRKLAAVPPLGEKYPRLNKGWEYIEDPTYSRSIGSHVCMTCSKFDFGSKTRSLGLY